MNDFIEYYSDVWLKRAIKDNNCSTERELYNKTLIDNEWSNKPYALAERQWMAKRFILLWNVQWIYDRRTSQFLWYMRQMQRRIPWIMRRLIYDMFYADEISEDVAYKLIDKLNKIKDKTKYSWER